MEYNPVTEKALLYREATEADQLGKLKILLGIVRPNNTFYEAKLGASGIDGSISNLEDFYQRCPFTTKDELVTDQSANAPYGTNLSLPIENFNRIHQTSGSTGKPLRWLDTPDSWQGMLDSWKIVYETAGVTEKDRALFPFSCGFCHWLQC